VSFAAITLCVAFEYLLLFISLPPQSGKFWIHTRTMLHTALLLFTVNMLLCGGPTKRCCIITQSRQAKSRTALRNDKARLMWHE